VGEVEDVRARPADQRQLDEQHQEAAEEELGAVAQPPLRRRPGPLSERPVRRGPVPSPELPLHRRQRRPAGASPGGALRGRRAYAHG
jgi:hypothetical protein